VTPEPVTPEPVTPEPVTPEPVTPEPVTPEPVTPEVVTPEPVAPEPVTPEPAPTEVAPTEVAPTDVVTPEVVTPQPTPQKPLSKKAQLAAERAAKKAEAEREKELIAAGRAYAKKELIEEVLDSGRIPHVSVVQRRTGDKNFNAELKRLFAETFPAEQPGPNEVLTSGEGAKTAKHLKWVDRDTKLPVVRNTETGQTRNLFTNDPNTTAMQVDKGLDVYVPKGVTPHRRIKINSENKVVAVDHPRYGWVSGRGAMADARAVDPEFLENQIAATGGEDIELRYFSPEANEKVADLDQQVQKLPLSDETRNELKVAEEAALAYINKKRLDGFEDDLSVKVRAAAGTKFSIDIRAGLIAEGRLPKGYGGYANKALADTISEAYKKLKKRPGRKLESFDALTEGDRGVGDVDSNERITQGIQEYSNEDLGEGSGPSGGGAGSSSGVPGNKPVADLDETLREAARKGEEAAKKAALEKVRSLANLSVEEQLALDIPEDLVVDSAEVSGWKEQDFFKWGRQINDYLPERLFSKKTAEAIQEQTPEVAKGIIGKLTEMMRRLAPGVKFRIVRPGQENLRNRQQRLESLSVDGVEAYYDKAADEVVFVVDNIDEERAGKLVYHELSHRNLALMEQTLAGRLELGRILETARPQLMAHLPELLASTGHKDLRALMQDYGYGPTLEGRAAVLSELMARYAERLDGRTKPSWWRELLSKVRVWLAKHFGVALDEDALEYWLAGNMERFASTPSGARSEERAYSKRAPVNGRTRQQSMARRAEAKLRRYGGPAEFQRDQFKPSEALSRASLAMDPKMREILREATYLPGKKADDLEAANRFIFSHNTLEDAILALDAANSQPFTSGRLSEEQAWLARGIIAGKLNKMALAMDVAPNSIGKRLLSKHYKDLAVDQFRKVQEELSQAGSFLSRVGRGLADLYFPEAVIRDLVDPVRKTQEEVLSKDEDAQAVVDAIDTSSEPAAEKAVAAAKPLFDRLRPAATTTPGVDEMQPVFDFFEGLMGEGTMKAHWNPTTGEWTEGKLVDAIADRLVKLTKASMAQAKAAKVPRPVIELLEKQIRSEVEARLKPLFRSKDFISPKAGPVQQLLKEIDNVDLVERAFNSSKEALLARGDLSPEERRAIEQAKFEGADLKAAQAVIRKAINLREIVQGHLADRNASLETLTQTILENAQISEAKASAVAMALKTAFDIEAERVVRARLDALQKERKPSRTKPIHASERLFALSNLGAFDTAEVYNAIAQANPHYKLPVYDEQFVKSVRQEADRIQTMPAGSDAKNAATVNLLSRVAHAHARNLRGFKKIMYYIGDVGPAVWQAGVLSGPPTALVNAIGTAMIVQYKAYSQAYGNYRAARKMGRNNAEASQFFKDVSKGWLDSVGVTRSGPSTAWMDAKQALKTGSTRFKNATRSELSILENYSLPHKWVGRLMLAADAYNTATADEIKQRQALRFAMMTQGKNAAEIMQAMNEAFHPEASSMAQIEQQILEETKAGHLGSGKELELNTQIRRTELLEQRRFTATPEIREIAREESEKWTLNGDPKGYAGLIFDGMFGRLNRETKVTKYFLSFMKTNANLLNLALDFSPLGLLHAYNKSPGVNLSKKYQLERIDRSTPQGEAKHQALFIQGMMGTLALGALVLKGLLDEEEGEDPWFAVYGPGPKTAMERQQLRDGSDWEPNTVKIGDLKLRYTDFPVLNLLLGAYGTLSDQARFDKKISDKDVVERASLWALGMANIVFERQMLSGLSNLFKIIQNPDSRGIHAVKQLTSGIAGGFTNPQAMKWMRNTLWLDENLKAPVLDQGSTAGWAASMVPFSAGYDSPALNVLGEPIKEYFWYPTTRRFFTLSEHAHPILGPVVSNGLMLEPPSKQTQIQVGGIKQAVGRSETAWRRFVELRGEEIKKRVPASFLSRLSTMKRELAQDQLNEVTKTARIAAVTRLEKELKSGATEF
jgi:hypothetical protein